MTYGDVAEWLAGRRTRARRRRRARGRAAPGRPGDGALRRRGALVAGGARGRPLLPGQELRALAHYRDEGTPCAPPRGRPRTTYRGSTCGGPAGTGARTTARLRRGCPPGADGIARRGADGLARRAVGRAAARVPPGVASGTAVTTTATPRAAQPDDPSGRSAAPHTTYAPRRAPSSGPAIHVSSSFSASPPTQPRRAAPRVPPARTGWCAPRRGGWLLLPWTQPSAPWLTTGTGRCWCWPGRAPEKPPRWWSRSPAGCGPAPTPSGSSSSPSAARPPELATARGDRMAGPRPAGTGSGGHGRAPAGDDLPLLLLRPGPRPPGRRPLRRPDAAAVRTRAGPRRP